MMVVMAAVVMVMMPVVVMVRQDVDDRRRQHVMMMVMMPAVVPVVMVIILHGLHQTGIADRRRGRWRRSLRNTGRKREAERERAEPGEESLHVFLIPSEGVMLAKRDIARVNGG